MKLAKQTRSRQKSYMPKHSLASFMRTRLELIEQEEKAKELDRPMYREYRKKITKSNRMKVHILDKVIFPSIANLVYFLETVAVNPDLRDLFNEDLGDLLDSGKNTPIQIQSNIGTKVGIDIRETMFTRFIAASLMLNQKNLEGESTNFRIKLVQDLQGIIYGKIMEILLTEYGYSNFNQLRESVLDDIRRALGWILFIGNSAQYENKIPRRSLGFPATNTIAGLYQAE